MTKHKPKPKMKTTKAWALTWKHDGAIVEEATGDFKTAPLIRNSRKAIAQEVEPYLRVVRVEIKEIVR